MLSTRANSDGRSTCVASVSAQGLIEQLQHVQKAVSVAGWSEGVGLATGTLSSAQVPLWVVAQELREVSIMSTPLTGNRAHTIASPSAGADETVEMQEMRSERLAILKEEIKDMVPADVKAICRCVDVIETLRRRLGVLQLQGLIQRCVDALHCKPRFYCSQVS